MQKLWLMAIFVLITSCGNKATESVLSPSHPNVTNKPPVATDQNQTDVDPTDSIFETEEFKNSKKLVDKKTYSLWTRGYRFKKNEDGSVEWEKHQVQNEEDLVLNRKRTWQEGWFATKFQRSNVTTHDVVTGEELSAYSSKFHLIYYPTGVYEFLSIDNWPIFEESLGELMDAIVSHYNKYESDLTEEMKADLAGRHGLVSSAYANAKSHVEYLSLPVMTWEQILEKYEIKEIIWVSKNTNLFHASNAMIDSDRSEIRRLISDEQVRILKETSPDQFDNLKKIQSLFKSIFIHSK